MVPSVQVRGLGFRQEKNLEKLSHNSCRSVQVEACWASVPWCAQALRSVRRLWPSCSVEAAGPFPCPEGLRASSLAGGSSVVTDLLCRWGAGLLLCPEPGSNSFSS